MTEPRTLLVCEDGTVFTGSPFASAGEAIGNLTATTSMTGSQEVLTSGAYAGTILLFTSPHVGTTGVNDRDGAGPIRPRGVVMRERPRVTSNWRAQGSLEEALLRAGTVGIVDLDTRALMRHLRDAGPLRAGIFTQDSRPLDDLLTLVRAAHTGTDSLILEAATGSQADIGDEPRVAVVDLGLGGQTAAALADRGHGVSLLPATATVEDVTSTGATRVILSGGPGDPADATIALGLARDLLATDLAVLGLGLGHQVLARALGFTTRALDTPHHGSNHPVRNLATGRVDITTHSHSYTVEITGDSDVEVTHSSGNDGTVEGFSLRGRPVRGFQYHPGVAAGPTDADHLLDSFLKDA